VREAPLRRHLIADLADARRSFGGGVLPRIPYRERTRLRLWLEAAYRSDAFARLRGAGQDALDRARGRRDPSLAQRRLPAAVGGGDYRGIGEEFRAHFVELGGLRPEHDVLDVGCGSGRMAHALADWLTGTYSGFDVVPEAIEWCRREITPRHPRFTFELADIRSARYNPRGAYEAAGYRFPYDDASFDFAIATSVFTHLERPAVDNYLAEIARVLRPGGRCFATYFLIDDGALRAMGGTGQFAYERDGQLVVDPHVPERAVAFREQAVRELHERHGLELEALHPGSWCGREDHTSFQDIALARRR
jgi:SAM-dependent methyltransferase